MVCMRLRRHETRNAGLQGVNALREVGDVLCMLRPFMSFGIKLERNLEL